MKIICILATCLLLLAACISEPEPQPHTIQNTIRLVNPQGQQLYHGMTRAAVAAILGEGEASFRNAYTYANDTLIIMYRDDTVAAIINTLAPEWQLANGVYLGMAVSPDTMLYGMSIGDAWQLLEDLGAHAIDASATFADYHFTAHTDGTLQLLTTPGQFPHHREQLDLFQVSLRISDDMITVISVGDVRMFTTLQ